MSFVNIIKTKYMIPLNIVIILYIILFFLLIKGLLCVSAGAKNIKNIIEIIAIAINIKNGILTYLQMSGEIINVWT